MRGQQGRVIEQLGLDIISGRYEPGELLPKEAELEAEYEVSRTSVREAMRVLAAKGLVDIRRRYGTSVRDRHLWSFFDSDILRWHASAPDGDKLLLDLIELRQILEPAAARLASARATAPDLRRLEVAAEQLAAIASGAGSIERYAEVDVEFHVAMYAASQNAILQNFGRLVADSMHLAFNLQQSARNAEGEDLIEDAKEHQAAYDAINRNAPEAAAEAVISVVLDGKSALIEALARRDQGLR
jgi:DNA-binding FadR family transcriptional regulator